jgi:hypothetical protein
MAKRTVKTIKAGPLLADKIVKGKYKADLAVRDAENYVGFLVRKFSEAEYRVCGNEEALVERALARLVAARKKGDALLGLLPTETGSAQLSFYL